MASATSGMPPGGMPPREFDPRERGIVRRTTAEWMQNHVAQPNGMSPTVFREEVGFVSQEQDQQLQLERREIWSEALVEARQLALAISDAQNRLCKDDPNFRRIDPQDFTFTELMNAVEKNRYRYESEGAKAFFRKGFRKLSENAESFKLWMEMVPQDTQYTAPVAGGIIIILSMADRIHKVREDVFKLITAVPEDFNELRDYLAVYEEIDDTKLQICAANVCTSIFKSLQQAMCFMAESPFKKALKAVRGARYEEEIDRSITKLKDSKTDFKDQIDKCLHSRVGSLFRLAKSSSMLQQMMIVEFLKFKDEAVFAINSDHQDLRGELQDLRNAVMNAMYNKLLTDQDDRTYIAESAARKMLEMEKQDKKRLRESKALSELLALLEYDSKEAKMDVLYCLREGRDLTDDDLARFSWIKKTARLRSWLVNDTSDSLMIEGNIDTAPYAYTSALSYLCAEMSHLFEAINKTMVVSHFCGLAAQPSSTREAGAKTMMASLIGQLLDSDGADALSEARVDKAMYGAIEKGHLTALCEAFDALVLQLPKPWTVICLIDTVNFYETPARLDGALEAINHLRKLAHKCKKHDVVFKLLVTEPKRSLYVAQEFSEQHRLIAPEDPSDSAILEPDLSEILMAG